MKYKIKYLHEDKYSSNKLLSYKSCIINYEIIDGCIEYENDKYSVIQSIKIVNKIYYGWPEYYSRDDIKAIYGDLNLETIEDIIIKNIIE